MRSTVPARRSDRAHLVVLDTQGKDRARVADADLVQRARDGDEWAMEMIYRRHVPLVASTARRLLRDDSDVEDVIQETFLIGLERLDQLADPGALRGWLARIAVSRVHRRFRRRKLRGWLRGEDPGARLEEQASPEASPEQRAELMLLDRALGRLPLRLRTPWVLRFVVGCQVQDVATACHCSLATVKRRIAEADRLVQQHTGQEGSP